MIIYILVTVELKVGAGARVTVSVFVVLPAVMAPFDNAIVEVPSEVYILSDVAPLRTRDVSVVPEAMLELIVI